MKRIVFLVLMPFFVLILHITVYAVPINTDAHAYILIDAKTGMVLSEKNADDRLYPASTTKILTAIVALEKGDLNKMMTASKEAVGDIGPDGMNIGISPGEELRMEDLLNAMLIQSANETANILAENLAPTRKDFIDMMNSKARELGAINTHFTNPCGMHDDEHYTTARDLSIMARYAMTIPKFREIVAKNSYRMAVTNMHKKWDMLYTTNKFLYQTSDYFSKVTGIKSGFTSQAGFNLVSSAVNDNGMELIAVVLGEKDHPQSTVVSDSKKLLEYGFQNYSIQKLADAGQIIKSMPVSGVKENINVSLVTENDLKCVLPEDKNERNISTSENINPDIRAPIQKGEVLGYMEYEMNGTKLGKVNLVAANGIEKSSAEKKKGKTGNPFLNSIVKVMIIVCLFLLFIILRLIFKNRRTRRRKTIYYTGRRFIK